MSQSMYQKLSPLVLLDIDLEIHQNHNKMKRVLKCLAVVAIFASFMACSTEDTDMQPEEVTIENPQSAVAEKLLTNVEQQRMLKKND